MRKQAAFCLATSLAIGLAMASSSSAQEAAKAPKTDDEQALYAAGALMAENMAGWNLSAEEAGFVLQGMNDAVLGKKLALDPNAARPKIQAFAEKRIVAAAEAEKKAAKPFLDKAAAEKGAKKTESGLIIKEVKAGSGASPTAEDKVKVHYHGTFPDGTVFDSSVDRGEPVSFPLKGVIPCWTEGLQLMKVGEKAKLVCPSDIAYGDRGKPPRIKPGATLVFDVELLEIEK